MLSERVLEQRLERAEDLGAKSSKPAAPEWISRFSVILCIAVSAALSIYRLSPPKAAPANAAPTEFSAERAMRHIDAVAQKAHPIGSTEQVRVREYILSELRAQDLQPEVQQTMVLGHEPSSRPLAATVCNILARLKGTGNTGAVMLSAHYDSVSTGPGASDDAAGVAAVIETIRALKAGPQLKNDVICLFTDGEEAGLLGARAFVAEHSWARDVAVDLNFEALGTQGPVVMFETTSGNRKLIDGLANAACHPIASSYMYDIYKALPHDTDLSVLKDAGMAGLNFAVIDRSGFHHSPLDNQANMDARSLQHEGIYALSLAREFGNEDLHIAASAGDAVFFDLLGLVVVHYPAFLIMPISLIGLALFVLIAAIGFKRHRLTIAGISRGFFALVVSAVLVALTATAVRLLLDRIQEPGFLAYQGGGGRGILILAGLSALAIGEVALVYARLGRNAGIEALAAGGLLVWVILELFTSLYFPGASYLFAWPLLFSLLALGFKLGRQGRRPEFGGSILRIVLAIPGTILIVPVIYALYLGTGLAFAGALMALAVLLIGVLIIQLGSINQIKMKQMVGFCCLAVLVSVGLITAAVLTGSRRILRPDSLFYGLNGDNGKALWISSDNNPDRWTTKFLGGDARRTEAPEFFPFSSRPYLLGPAPAAELAAPVVAVLENAQTSGGRRLRLRIQDPRQAPRLAIYTDDESEVLSASINGKEIPDFGNRLTLRYFGLPRDGIELTLNLAGARPLKMRIVDTTDGFADSGLGFDIPPRPQELYPKPNDWVEDSVLVSKTYTL
jgi:hypothetical protein